MKKSVKILIITAVVMIILGIALCIGGAMAGGLSMATDVLKNIKVGSGELKLEVINSSHEVEVHHEKRSDRLFFGSSEISNMDIEVSAAELIFALTDSDKIEVTAEKDVVDVYTKNQVLYIVSNPKLKDRQITVYIPRDCKFREVDISAGASALTIEKLFADSIDIEIGAGAVQIDEIEAIEAEFEIGAGEIIVSKGQVKNCSANIGMGNFEYTGNIDRECDVECDMGNADFYLVNADKKDYNYEIEVGAGEVTVGDESFGGLAAEKHMNHHAERHMDIECGVGSVNIEF